jgi:hypothetical protein
MERPAPKAATRASYEDTCLELAWATTIVAFMMLVLLAIL